jgi:hypothetical protein
LYYPLYPGDLLLVNSFLGAPAIAQMDEAATLDKRVVELRKAGKFSETISLALRALANRGNALGADHSDVARELNDVAELYRAQGPTLIRSACERCRSGRWTTNDEIVKRT